MHIETTETSAVTAYEVTLTDVSRPVLRLIEKIVENADAITARAKRGQRSNYQFRVSKHGSYAQLLDTADVGCPD